MSFHKRYITKDSVILIYERDGIEGLKRWFNADALIVQDNIDTNSIIKCLTEDDTSGLEELVNNLKENC